MSSDLARYPATWRPRRAWPRSATSALQSLRARPELLGLLGVAAVLNLWGLSINGWANTYYSAAVRSMSTSWHNFLFGSMDPSGLMTVDKPPAALWVQALSVRLFGYHPLSILVPQALMGVAAAGLIYDVPVGGSAARPASWPAWPWPPPRWWWPSRATTTPTSCWSCAAWPPCGWLCARSRPAARAGWCSAASASDSGSRPRWAWP